jgi:glycosyltransferase involved in cell wall biosynthesis
VRSDVPRLLQASDLFTLMSLSEAASLTLLEAMVTALPIVVTSVGGNPEMVRDGREGLLVPRGDAEAAARAMLRLLDDPRLAWTLGEAARTRAWERYHLNRTILNYANMYDRIDRG